MPVYILRSATLAASAVGKGGQMLRPIPAVLLFSQSKLHTAVKGRIATTLVERMVMDSKVSSNFHGTICPLYLHTLLL